MKTIRRELINLKENKDTDDKARQLYNLIYSDKLDKDLEEYADEAFSNVVSKQYVTSEINNVMYYTGLSGLGVLIKGITNWEASWFWLNSCDNIEDLTNDKLDTVIDDILTQIAEDEKESK